MNKKNKFKTPVLIIAWKRPKQTQELINKVKLINPKIMRKIILKLKILERLF